MKKKKIEGNKNTHTQTPKVIPCLLSLQHWGGIHRKMDSHRLINRETRRWSHKPHFTFSKEIRRLKIVS
jgi:hypothetical protein